MRILRAFLSVLAIVAVCHVGAARAIDVGQPVTPYFGSQPVGPGNPMPISPAFGLGKDYSVNPPSLGSLGTLLQTAAANTLADGVCEVINASTTAAYLVSDDGGGDGSAHNQAIKPIAPASVANSQGGGYVSSFRHPNYRFRLYGAANSPWVSMECR